MTFSVKIQNHIFPGVTQTHMYPLELGLNRVKPLRTQTLSVPNAAGCALGV